MALDFLLCDCINSCDKPIGVKNTTTNFLYFNHVGDVCDMLPVSCTGQNAA